MGHGLGVSHFLWGSEVHKAPQPQGLHEIGYCRVGCPTAAGPREDLWPPGVAQAGATLPERHPWPWSGCQCMGTAPEAHCGCSSPSEAWALIAWCQEQASPGAEPAPLPASQNKVSLTHAPRCLSVSTKRRGLIRRACPICLPPEWSCKARDGCPPKSEREEGRTGSLAALFTASEELLPKGTG